LFGKYGFEYDLKKVLEEFVMSTWAEYSFGPSVNKEKYMYLQKFTIETLRKTFYSASTISLPYVGSWVSRVRKFIYKKDLETIDEMLKDFLSSTSDGYLHRFNQELKASIDNDTLREKILHDNAFLSLLVFDFIYLVLLQVLLNNHEKEKTKHLSKGFLFPNRFRIIKKTSENYQEGDYAIVNLVHSKLFFSYGPRSCVGPMIFEKFYTSLLDSIKDFKISLDNDNVTYSSDPNIPVVTSTHRIRYTLNENYLTQVLPFYEKEESKPLVSQQLQKKLKFYRMEACTENPILFSYIIDSLSQKVPKDCQYIFTAEARGFLFAAPVAHKLGLPLVLMRKKGKIVGPVEAVEYLKAYGSTETLEVPKLSCRGKAIIIDDGIASGGTTQAMYVLSSKVQAEIMKVLVVVRHGYTKCSYTQTPVEHVFAY
jgi:adenine phosphoribosyltransferase